MPEFNNVKIIGAGTDGTITSRSATGSTSNGADYTVLNILNLDQLYVHSASGNFPAAATAAAASAALVNFTATTSGFAGFIKIKLSDGTFRSIPMYNSTGY